jgi:hypothetical protein
MDLDRQQISRLKTVLAKRILVRETLADENSYPAVVVALAELAADLSFALLGPELTLHMLLDLADRNPPVEAAGQAFFLRFVFGFHARCFASAAQGPGFGYPNH